MEAGAANGRVHRLVVDDGYALQRLPLHPRDAACNQLLSLFVMLLLPMRRPAATVAVGRQR